MGQERSWGLSHNVGVCDGKDFAFSLLSGLLSTLSSTASSFPGASFNWVEKARFAR